MNHRALFLDRDGVINVDTGYVFKSQDFIFNEGIFDICKAAKFYGYLILIVTNQAGIGRGFYSEADFFELMNWVQAEFKGREIEIDGIYFCPYHPTAGVGMYKRSSFDRKPNPGMILSAALDFGIDLKKSVLIGDRDSDIQAANNAGINNRILIGSKSPLGGITISILLMN